MGKTVQDETRDALVVVGLGLGGLAAAAGVYFLVRYLYPVGAVVFGGRQYRFTDEDRLWAARMAYGEAGSCRDDPRPCAAVLWSVATRWVTNPRFQGWSFTQLMRNFSTPIMAGGRTVNMPWESIPESVRGIVDDFVRGRVANPIPGYNNFAASYAIRQSSLQTSELSPVDVGGNMFIRDPGALPGSVRIV